jgi:hypothetical protein
VLVAVTGVMAIAMSFALVMAVCMVPSLVGERSSRSLDRAPKAQRDPSEPGVHLAVRSTAVGDRVATIVLVGGPVDRRVEPPPGIPALPEAGTAYLSPALDEHLDGNGKEMGLGEPVGIIGPDGLVDAGELYAYVGVDESTVLAALLEQDPGAGRGGHDLFVQRSTFGREPWERPPSPYGWLGVVLLLMLGPLGALVSAALRLAETATQRQLAAIRLIGANSSEMRIVRSWALLPTVVMGILVGFSLAAGLSQVLAGVEIAGRSWYRSDVRLMPAAVAGAACVGLVARWSIRRVVARAVADPRSSGGSDGGADEGVGRSRWWCVAPALAGSIVLLAVVVLGGSDRYRPLIEVSAGLLGLHVAAIVALLVSLFAAGPFLVAEVGRWCARSARSPQVHIAGRICERTPSGPARWCALIGTAALVGSLGVGYGEAIVAPSAYRNPAPVGAMAVTGLSSNQVLPALRAEPRLPIAPLWILDSHAESDEFTRLVAGSCEAYQRVEPRISGCVPGVAAYTVGEGTHADIIDVEVGGERLRIGPPTHRLTSPIELNHDLSGTMATTFIDTDVVGLGLDLAVPHTILVAGSTPAQQADVVELVATVDPFAHARTAESARAEFRREVPIDDRAARGLVAVLVVLLGCGLVVALVDRSLETSAKLRSLRAIGMPRRACRRIINWTTMLPVLALLPPMAVLLALVSLSWSRVSNQALRVDPSGLVWLVGATAIVAVTSSVIAAFHEPIREPARRS